MDYLYLTYIFQFAIQFKFEHNKLNYLHSRSQLNTLLLNARIKGVIVY